MLPCAVCKNQREKSTTEFELLCSCGTHGVCRPCYATSGPAPGTSYEDIKKYGWKLSPSEHCSPLLRCTIDGDDRFVSVADLQYIGLEPLTIVFASSKALKKEAEERERCKARVWLSLSLCLVLLFFIFLFLHFLL